jgi:hypothetical protein
MRCGCPSASARRRVRDSKLPPEPPVTALPFTNALGLFQLAFNAFPGAPPTGLFWYSQVVTLDATSALVVSNQHINLFTP